MKKAITFILNAALSVALGIMAVYVISFLNMVPHSMQVDLPHYMYPDVMPASGTTANDAEKARERLEKKVHHELVEAGIIEEPEEAPLYVPTPRAEASSRLRPYSYSVFSRPLGHSLVQQGYFTVGDDGEADRYFSPGPDGVWYVYDPATGQVSAASGDASKIPCSYEDLITFTVSRDPTGIVSSDMAEILSESEPTDDLSQLVKSAANCFGNRELTGKYFASLLQYQAAGLFLGFTDAKQSSNQGMAYYLSGEDRRTITQVVYNTKYAEFHTESVPVDSDIISVAMNKEFYTYNPDMRTVGKISFWSTEQPKGLRKTEIGTLPEGYTGTPVVGLIGKTPCCVFAGNSSVQMMDLTSGEISEVTELTPTDGDAFSSFSFVFGTDRLVLFYTTESDPGEVQVSEVLYSSQEG